MRFRDGYLIYKAVAYKRLVDYDCVSQSHWTD